MRSLISSDSPRHAVTCVRRAASNSDLRPSVSHSTTEASVAALAQGLRLEAIPRRRPAVRRKSPIDETLLLPPVPLQLPLLIRVLHTAARPLGLLQPGVGVAVACDALASFSRHHAVVARGRVPCSGRSAGCRSRSSADPGQANRRSACPLTPSSGLEVLPASLAPEGMLAVSPAPAWWPTVGVARRSGGRR